MISLLPADRRSRFGLVLAAVLAVPLVVVVFWVWESYRASPTLQFEGFKFQVLEGQGRPAQGGVSITAVGPQGRAIVAVPMGIADARRYPRVSFVVSGLDRASGAGVYWTNTGTPEVGHPRGLSLDEVRSGEITLSSDPRWSGSIESLGFIIQGPLNEEVIFRSVGVLSDSTSFLDVAGRLKSNWLALADWDGGSVNFHIGASRTERLMTPAMSVLLWVFLTFGLFELFKRFGFVTPRNGTAVTLLGALFLFAWASLDMRWQAELFSRNLTDTEDPMLVADARRGEALAQVRDALALGQSESARVFVVSHDPTGFVAYRTRYHLGATRTSFAMDRLPTDAERRPGDYLLLLSSTEPLTVDKRSGFVASRTESVPADFMTNSSEFGVLLRVRSGG